MNWLIALIHVTENILISKISVCNYEAIRKPLILKTFHLSWNKPHLGIKRNYKVGFWCHYSHFAAGILSLCCIQPVMWYSKLQWKSEFSFSPSFYHLYLHSKEDSGLYFWVLYLPSDIKGLGSGVIVFPIRGRAVQHASIKKLPHRW